MSEFDLRTRRSRIPAVLLPAVGVVVAIGAWWLVTVVFDLSSLYLPAPPDLLDALKQEGRLEFLYDRSVETLEVTLVGFAIAMAGGFLIAILLTAFRTVEQATLPVLVGLNSVPKVALAPLLVVWLGFELKPKIVMVVLICFFPIIVATMSGLASMPADLGELVSSLSASRWQAYLKVRVPWALPQIFVGLKVAVPLAVIGAVVAETNNPNTGLGSAIVKASQQLDTSLAFVCLLLLAILSSALFYVVVGLEWLVLPWARAIAARKG